MLAITTVLADHAPPRGALAQFIVAQAHGIALDEMRAQTRRRPQVAQARQIAVYLTRSVFGLNIRQLADEFRRHPSTVGHALEAIADRRARDAQFDSTLRWLETLLRRAAGQIS